MREASLQNDSSPLAKLLRFVNSGRSDMGKVRVLKNAAIEILKINDQPMKPSMIAEEAERKGLLRGMQSKSGFGHDIWWVIWGDIKRNGSGSVFLKFGKGLFGLSVWQDRFGNDLGKIKPARDTTRRSIRRHHGSIREFSDGKLLGILKDEIRTIKSFIKGSGGSDPTPDKAYFWIWFCYNFELYQEGALLFRKIDCDKIPQEIRSTIRKLGLICEEKM